MPQDATPKRTRRARGTGSLFWSDSRQLWVGRKPVGRTPGGRTSYAEVTARTQAECVRRMAAAGPPAPTDTVAAHAAAWLRDLPAVRRLTRDTYRAAVEKHILPRLGHLPAAAVTRHRVEAFRDTLLADGYAPATVTKILAVLRAMFSHLVGEDRLPRNPVTHARKPKPRRTPPAVLSPEDLNRVVGMWDSRPAADVVAVMAATGMRVGEACGLNVPDYDPATNRVTIRRTASAPGGDAGLGPPKSDRSARTITLPDNVAPAVRAAAAGRTAGPLFRARRGGRWDRARANLALAAVLRDLGLPRVSNHALRHSVATAMVGAGVPVADVAAYLGDTVATVIRVYVHPTAADPAAALSRLFGGG